MLGHKMRIVVEGGVRSVVDVGGIGGLCEQESGAEVKRTPTHLLCSRGLRERLFHLSDA